nr:dihydrofolate reductase family protein [Aquihabitans sp. G128]
MPSPPCARSTTARWSPSAAASSPGRCSKRGLVDEFVLMVHPLVLGEGRRFFEDAPLTRLELLDEVTTATGVLVATYRVLADG